VCRTSRLVRFFAVLLALGGGLALFVPAAGGGLPDRYHPHRIEAAVEALAEYPSLPPGWKTGTAALRERAACRKCFQCPCHGLDPANVPAVDW
jgi:hypothetical protein